MPDTAPNLVIVINHWTMWNQLNADGEPWSAEERMDAVAKAGFEAFTCPSDIPGLQASLNQHGLRFAAAFDCTRVEEFEPKIAAGLAIDDGPINVQLGNHDTPIEDAIQLTIALMETAERLGADVHLEMHRDTCTETPEKAYAIAEGYKAIKGVYPKINFDFSHPASVKHLGPHNYIERLFENVPLFQQSTLWHMRPFNGHHCQVPVTDGQGNFSPEYEDMRPFIKQAFAHWLAGPQPRGELWVCPELGPKIGYGLSCFPDSWEDSIVLGNDIRKIWNECLNT
ncbi:hypothetical protein [Cerasicoccus fimbriatus]|uniref:hypothetical protein n=1 Tax=Cerasicoccus fimbriatus TaxID=3014554 RepID=UPI0022B59F66|nr:hypothetical protein [Cerasicoccus sp. TK19100]